MSILIVFLTDARTAFQLYKKERKRRSRAFPSDSNPDAELLARYRITISTAAASATYFRNTPRMGYIGASVSNVHANSIKYGIATASDCIRWIHLYLVDILHGGDFP